MAESPVDVMNVREEKLTSCLNILRRTPPGDAEENIAGLASLLSPDEDAVEELYQRADPPLGHAIDSQAKDAAKPFIICDYNRDGDSYRSPWSNAYYPPLPPNDGDDDQGFQPPTWLRNIEIGANELFDSYRSVYYGDGSVASVYLWDREDGSSSGSGGGFAGAFLIKKEVKDDRHLKHGVWNSIHVVEVNPSQEGRTASYGMTTTIALSMDPAADGHEGTNIAGSITRRTERVCPLSSSDDGSQHIPNIGSMIEDVEIEMRSTMDSLNIQKTRYSVDSIRSSSDLNGATKAAASRGATNGGGALSNQQKVATMLTEAVLQRQANK